MSKLIAVGTTDEVSICLALEPPKAGVPVGGGLHVVIPPDYAARIAAGQKVAGCTYASIEPDGSLVVTDTVIAKLSDTNATKDLDPVKVTALQTAVATAVAIPDAEVLIG
jgi:hypothetical protein